MLSGRRGPLRVGTKPSFSYADTHGSMKLKAHSYSAASITCPRPVRARASSASDVPKAA